MSTAGSDWSARTVGVIVAGVLRNVAPVWFTCVMGTAAVAVAAALLPGQGPVLEAAAVGLWAVALLLLAVLGPAAALAWRRGHRSLRADALDGAVAPFLAAPPIAALTVASSTALSGTEVLGPRVALVLAGVLWALGTAGGLIVAVIVPAAKFTRHDLRSDTWMPTWVLPTVPPLVAAGGAAIFAPHLPEGQWQLTLIAGAWAMLGATLVATFVGIAMLWTRLAFHRLDEAAAVPTLWLVLGPLGQAVTAAALLGHAGEDVLPAPYGTGLRVGALALGLPLWGFALLWLAIAAVITADAARRHLPFSLGWWAFVYPLGTLTMATSLLADATGGVVFTVLAGVLFTALLAAFAAAAAGTLRDAARGRAVAAGILAP